jgi:hypothetical protein
MFVVYYLRIDLCAIAMPLSLPKGLGRLVTLTQLLVFHALVRRTYGVTRHLLGFDSGMVAVGK